MVLNKENIPLVIVVVAIIAASVVVVLAPDKLFIPVDDPEAGIRLLRDDFEISVFHNRGSWLPNGTTPYDPELFQEYPQVGLMYITLPHVLSSTYEGYRAVLIVLNLLCYGALIVVTHLILKKLERSNWYLLLFLLPSMLYFSFSRFDIFIVLLAQLSLYLLLSKRYTAAFVVLALAVLTKWYPLLFLPAYVMYLRAQLTPELYRAKVKRGLVVFGSIIVAVMGVSFIIDGANSLIPYLFHSSRPAGVGSFYFHVVQKFLLGFNLEQVNYFGISVFFFLQFIVPVFLLVRFRQLIHYMGNKKTLIMWLTLAILLFTFFSRFYSPQWVLWFFPLLILVVRNRLALGLIIVYDILNYVTFPIVWQSIGFNSVQFITASLVLGAIVLTLALLVVRWIIEARKKVHLSGGY